MIPTAKVLAVATVLAFGSMAAVAQAADDRLLDFEGMTDADRTAAESAHKALDDANWQMCEVVVRHYAGHIAHSTAIHDLIRTATLIITRAHRA